MSGYATDDVLAAGGLVDGRECGQCTICCTALKINEPDFKKLAGVTCGHCVNGVGCSIYDSRYDVCREWHCGWRRFAWLSPEMWPQTSGIMVRIRHASEEQAAGPRLGLTFHVLTSHLALYTKPVWNAIGTAILNGIPTYLGVSAPVGYEGRTVYLNDALRSAFERRDGGEIKRALRRAYYTGRAAPKAESVFN